MQFGNCAFDAATRRRFAEHYVTAGEDVDAALARAELFEILAVHANGVVFTWAAYGYREKFAPIAAEMEEVIDDHTARTAAAISEGRHRELADRVAAHDLR